MQSYKKNSIGGSIYSIRANNGKYIYLNYGYNNIIPNMAIPGAKSVYGTLSGYGSSPVTLISYHNKWNLGNTKPIYGIDYQLTTSSGGATITLLDKFPGSMTCAKSGESEIKTPDNDNLFDPPLEASLINTLNFPETYIDDAVNQVISQIDDYENPLSNDEAVSLLGEIIMYEIEEPNLKDEWYTGLAYIKMGEILGNAIVNGETENKGKENAMISKALKVEAKLLKKNYANDYYNSLFTGIDLANLLHVSGKSQKAIKLLNKMLKHAEDEDLDYINYVLCLIETEIAIEDGNIPEDEIELAMSLCEYEEDDSVVNKSGGIANNSNVKLNSAILSEIEDGELRELLSMKKLAIYPNPVTGLSQIKVNLDIEQAGVIKIYDIQGRIVQQYSLKSGDNIINISKSDFREGIYNVVLYEDGINKDSKKIIVN